MIGYVYIIKNDIHNKVYIGITAQSIQKRWYDHIRSSETKNSKFYKEMRKIGVEHFSINVLEQCDVGELNEREQYYIKKYDSFHNGYNSTLGGFGTHTYELDEQSIIKMYSDYGLSYIAEKYDCSKSVIKCILQRNNIPIREANVEKLAVVMISKDYNVISVFTSKSDAYDWLIHNYRDMKKAESYYYIKCSCEYGSIAFGYRWMYYDEISGEDGQIDVDAIMNNIQVQNERKHNRVKGEKSRSYKGNNNKSHGRPSIKCKLYLKDGSIKEFNSLKDLASYFTELECKVRTDKQMYAYAYRLAICAREGKTYKGYKISINE